MSYHNYSRDVELAYTRINRYIRNSPLEVSYVLSIENQNQVYLKLENIQHSGSFKVRGALNKILLLTLEERERGVISASTGNHALAVAYALKLTDSTGTIYLPNKVSELKLKKLRQSAVNLEFYGDDSGLTERKAREEAKNQDVTFISPYNDPDIIAGQGTIGVELALDLEQIDHTFITVGGGGLIAGVSSFLKNKFPNIKIYGCQPENSPVMFESVKAGKIIEMESKDTLSDGSAGGLELNSITFPLVKELVDEFILVTESEIKDAIRLIFENHNQIIEGAAGVAVASYLKIKDRIEGNAVILICGGNISPKTFLEIVT